MIVELVAIGSVSVVASLAYTARIVRLALEAEKAWIPPKPPPSPYRPHRHRTLQSFVLTGILPLHSRARTRKPRRTCSKEA